MSENIKELKSIQLDRQIPIGQVLDRTETIRQKLNDIQLSYDVSPGLSQKQADKLDSVMAMMQYSLLNSQTLGSRTPRRTQAQRSTLVRKFQKKTFGLQKSVSVSRPIRQGPICSTSLSPIFQTM